MVTQYGPKREMFFFTGLVLPVKFNFYYVSSKQKLSSKQQSISFRGNLVSVPYEELLLHLLVIRISWALGLK
jgi:hypothetical protein